MDTCRLVQSRMDKAVELQQVARMMYEVARVKYALSGEYKLISKQASEWQRASAIVSEQARYCYTTALMLADRLKT